jgi:predicted transcriptional regulator
MTTLKVGIADYEEMKARTMRIARATKSPRRTIRKCGSHPPDPSRKSCPAGTASCCASSTSKRPASLEELSEITGRAKSNLSRTLKKMASYGVRMEAGEAEAHAQGAP